MKKLYHYLYSIALTLLLGMGLCGIASAADKLLIDKHTEKGLQCAQCHTQATPEKANASEEKCIACHGGSYEELAKKTEKLDPNPHYTHLGDMPCGECHKVHQPSANMCASCHNLDIKVP